MKEEFIKLIESIGFKYDYGYYNYKICRIDLYDEYYHFNTMDLDTYYYIPYTDIKVLKDYFKKEIRSIKLKNILYDRK